MYYYLLGAMKRRLISELKSAFSAHPVYQKIVPYIENRYSFSERPQYGIVVKGASTNKVQLSGDNFVGSVTSYVMLAYVGKPTYPIEWVREDLECVMANNDMMPTPPGIYQLEILRAPDPTGNQPTGEYTIDPLLTVTDEPVLVFQSGIETHGRLQQIPVQGTVHLWENRHYLLKEGTDYSVDYVSGEVTFLVRYYPTSTIVADYHYVAQTIGPVEFQWNSADFTTLHGVVMAFGKRASAGDKVAIVVYPDRVNTARAFGGKTELTFDLEVLSQDPIQVEEISDLVIMYLWGERKPVLESEGIELLDVSIGGEAEETYDETGDTTYYTTSMSVQFRADWEIHIPLPLTISKASAVSEGVLGTETFERATTGASGIQALPANSLFYATAPILPGRNSSFERIS